MVCFQQIRMRIGPVPSCSDNFFNSLYTPILVVRFQKMRMRIVTVRTFLTISSIPFVLPKDSYPRG